MDEVIRTENLVKYYGKVRAVDGISLSVHQGETYGFLGLNGAGKTTTIRLLLGMVRPTLGSAYLNGVKVHAGQHELWQHVGYLVEIPYSYPDLTVTENLEIARKLRLISDQHAVASIIEKLKLGPYRNRLAKNLSQGNAQRLGIAKALIHNPDILLLDEPANELDPAGVVEIRELLRDLALNHGATVFISSHILGEIARFATRIGIIHEGKLVQEADFEQLEKARHRSLVVHTREIDQAKSILTANGYQNIVAEQTYLKISDPPAILNPEKVNILLVEAGFPPTMLKVEEEDLESYFLRVIGMNGGVA